MDRLHESRLLRELNIQVQWFTAKDKDSRTRVAADFISRGVHWNKPLEEHYDQN